VNLFVATGHVKTVPERRTSAAGKPIVYFTLEVEDEIFPGRSRYAVAAIDRLADYALANLHPGSEVFVQGRLRSNDSGATIFARHVRAFVL
jgi:hypothetical protein